MTDHPIAQLSAYLDGDLDAGARAAVETHLTRCGECARTLDELRRVARQARALRERGAEPAPAVWDAIARHVEQGRPAEPRAAARWRLTLTAPQLAAAGLLLMMASAGGGYLLRPTADAPRPAGALVAGGDSGTGARTDTQSRVQIAAAESAAATQAPDSIRPRMPGGAVMKQVVLPWSQYDAASADLERVLEEGRGKLRPETVRAIEQSVASIDRAIEQARQALAKDPANEYLSRHLAENMKRKLDLLRQAAAIVRQS